MMTVSQQEQLPRCFVFKKGHSEGRTHMKALLGGKGANLCEMARLGLNVPPGLTVTTAMCEEFQRCGGELPPGLWEDVLAALKEVEQAYGKPFASTEQVPLLLSVRSGAAISMPGMMDTVLNLGLNDAVTANLAKHTSPRFALDCYRRLLDMYADVVLGAEHSLFEAELRAVREAAGVKFDVELSEEDLQTVVDRYKAVYKQHGLVIPDDPHEQLRAGISAVFRSWNTPRAVKYREINKVTGLRGTAVNVQAMVYGNFSDTSGTGVCFTRNPATGEHQLFGEFLINAQGEDVVAGIRTPQPIKEMQKTFPKIYDELLANTTLLERHLCDMQDCEFTLQDGTLYMLQTRNGKRTGPAALRVATDMVGEGLVTKEQAVLMVEARHLDQLLHPQFKDAKAYAPAVIGSGLAASPGAAVGRVVFSAADAEAWKLRGERVVLVRHETSPEDVGGMHAAAGILTSTGGMTSHAAVVARGWGKPCVCGCDGLAIDYKAKTATLGGVVLKEGDSVSLNGTTGEVIQGEQELTEAGASVLLEQFMEWVDAVRTLAVLTNCDTPEDALFARKAGAQGIGLVRTEHMFFGSAARIAAVRSMIGAMEVDPAAAGPSLAEIEAFQKDDFEGIFKAMDGLPVTIRLLDPPLHEFLPQEGDALKALIERLARELKTDAAMVQSRLASLHEANPMLGFRGCRLGIVHPEITSMQVRAIARAALAAQAAGVSAQPHIMIPLIGSIDELLHQIRVVRAAVADVTAAAGSAASIDYKLGTMIETPRACIVAEALAHEVDFFSFGTNDLTQMTLGFSRDDAEAHFLKFYQRHGVMAFDPFERVDVEGVGALMRMAAERGLRGADGKLTLGVCGEHGGNPESIEFFNSVPGMTYVSCSPLRVPIARLGAAQAALKAAKAKA
uniref:Pyruvate, phosphate dikinase n=1 Tax=Ulva linza TaxID=63409 RepID=G1FKV8_9CHLO|nr:pyruvate orthophosphate dikinase [Ulva linza]